MKLKQFAVYSPGAAPKARRAPTAHERRHGHQHFHAHDKEIREIQEDVEKRGVGDMVTVTMNGKVATWANQYAGGAGGSPATPAADDKPYAEKYVKPQQTAKPDPDAKDSPNKGGDVPDVKGDWVRAGYYNAKGQKAEGITFLNHLGNPAVSGDFRFVHLISLALFDRLVLFLILPTNRSHSVARLTDCRSRTPPPMDASPRRRRKSSPTPPSRPTTRSSS